MLTKIDQIDKLREKGLKFTWQNFSNRTNPSYGGTDSPEWLTWKTRVDNYIHGLVDSNSASIALLREARRIETQGNEQDKFNSQQDFYIAALDKTQEALMEDNFNELRKSHTESDLSDVSNRVFVVHGHDTETKNELEIFLKNIGLDPVVLHKKPDQGRIIIQKFEDYADVGYAFVILTPDEIAYTIEQEKIEDSKRKKENRSRPNVIFEFGYFAAKLTLKRVCCLVKGEVSRPSDIDGLVYKKIDRNIESIAYAIMQELNAAGYDINMQVSQ